MHVLDASAVVELLMGTPRGVQVAALIDSGSSLHAPELLGVEVASVLRRLVRLDEITAETGGAVLADLRALGIEMCSHELLLERVFELRNVLTAYDATYVALAEVLACDIVTCDAKLAGATGHRARFTVVA